MLRHFVKRARYINRQILLQRTAGAKHQWNHDLIWGNRCYTRDVRLQQASSWTASINLLVLSTSTRQISSSCTYLRKAYHGAQSGSIKSAIERNRRIITFGKADDWTAMLSLYAQEKSNFDIVNYTTLMTRIARIRSVNTNHPLFLEFLDDMAYRVVNDGISQIGTRDISNIIYSFGKINLKNTSSIKILDWLSKEDVADVFAKWGNAQDVSNVVWAYASLEETIDRDLFEAIDKHTDRIFEEGTPQAVSNTIWGFAKLGFKPHNLLSYVERHADWLVGNGNPQGVANSVWAFATLEMKAPNLFAHVERNADWLVKNGDPQNVSNSVWAFATLGMEAPNLFAHVERHAEWLIENGKPQEVANSVWAFATLKIQAPNFFGHVERNADWLVENSDAQAISNTAWAFATVKIQAPNLFTNIEEQAEWLVENGNPQDFSNTAWACATLGIQAPDLFLHIEEQAEWLVRNGNPQEVANTAWAFAVVGYKSEELFKFLDLHLKKISVKSDLQVQDVTNISYAIAVLDISKKHKRLLLHLWTIACQMDPNVFQEESMSQLVQVKLFAEADEMKLPEFPLQLQKKMRKISVNDTQSRSQKQVSSCITDLGFNHDVEVSPVDDCIIEGMLAIDMACKKRKIAIEFDGPHHFMKDIKTGDITRMEKGATKAKRRFLERNSWTVININYQDWMKVSKKSTQKKFLRKTLIEAGVEL